jgi:DNA-binding transcriptional MerR regulator
MPAKHSTTHPFFEEEAFFHQKVEQWLCRQQETRKLGSAEIARTFHVSLRQLQWWDERHVIEPAHEGHARKYSFEDAVLIGAISDLRSRNMTLGGVRRILRTLAREVRNHDFSFRRYAIVTANELTWADDPDAACRLLATEKRRVWLVDLYRVAQRIHERFTK